MKMPSLTCDFCIIRSCFFLWEMTAVFDLVHHKSCLKFYATIVVCAKFGTIHLTQTMLVGFEGQNLLEIFSWKLFRKCSLCKNIAHHIVWWSELICIIKDYNSTSYVITIISTCHRRWDQDSELSLSPYVTNITHFCFFQRSFRVDYQSKCKMIAGVIFSHTFLIVCLLGTKVLPH